MLQDMDLFRIGKKRFARLFIFARVFAAKAKAQCICVQLMAAIVTACLLKKKIKNKKHLSLIVHQLILLA